MARALHRPALPHERELRLAWRSPRTSSGRPRARGLTHLAITDHDRIDGALEARDAAPAGLTVIVGEEVKTADGDLICALPRARPSRRACRRPRRSRRSASRAAWSASRIRSTGSAARCCEDARDGVARRRWSTGSRRTTRGSSASGNERAAEFAREHGLPGVAVSDAHSILEVGVAYTALDGDPSTPAGLLAALAGAELVAGRATLLRPPLDADRQGRPAGSAATAGSGRGTGDDRPPTGTPVNGRDGQDHRPVAPGDGEPVGSGRWRSVRA